MKLLFLIKAVDNMGGTERVTIVMANELACRGHEVHIVSLVGSGTPFFRIDSCVDVRYLAEKERSVFPVRDFRRHKRIKKSLADISPDIVIVVDVARALFKIPACKPYKTVYWEHFNVSVEKNPMRKLARRLASEYGDMIVTLTEQDAETYRRQFGAKRVTCIPNPVSFEVPPYKYSGNRLALAVGRLTEQKGFDLLLEAWHDIPDKAGWCLHIVGKGKQKAKLEAIIAAYGLSDSVSIFPPTDDVRGLLSEAGLYVLSSRFEGLPLVLIEAQAMGLPAVSFDCPTGPSEIIVNGETGLLVENGNVKALSEAVGALLKADAKRKSFSAGAYRMATDKFSLKTIAGRWEALFERISHESV